MGKLRLVGSVPEIVESVAVFNREAKTWAYAPTLARATSYWVFDPRSNLFGPSKFVGFSHLTTADYEQAQSGDSDGDRFDGHTTQTKIESLAARPYSPNADLAKKLIAWAQQLWGPNALRGIAEKKWKFIELKTERSAPHHGPYQPAKWSPMEDSVAIFEVDLVKLERGRQAHVDLQNQLAAFLCDNDIEPTSPLRAPHYDVAWMLAETRYVAEVKSITVENEAQQLRLGLGQVLWYRHLISDESKGHVRSVLVVEREPTDRAWLALCESLQTLLVWPERFALLLTQDTPGS